MVTCWSTGLCCGNEPTCSDHERGRDAAVVPGWERRSSSTRSRAAPPVRPTVVVPTRNEARNPAPAPHLPLAARRAGHHRPGACAVTVALPERFAGRPGRPEDAAVLLVPAGRAVRLAPSATVPRRDWGGARAHRAHPSRLAVVSPISVSRRASGPVKRIASASSIEDHQGTNLRASDLTAQIGTATVTTTDLGTSSQRSSPLRPSLRVTPWHPPQRVA